MHTTKHDHISIDTTQEKDYAIHGEPLKQNHTYLMTINTETSHYVVSNSSQYKGLGKAWPDYTHYTPTLIYRPLILVWHGLLVVGRRRPLPLPGRRSGIKPIHSFVLLLEIQQFHQLQSDCSISRGLITPTQLYHV